MTVEHHATQSTAPEEVNRYENCLYACRFCNNARNARPQQSGDGEKLLDPSLTAWADHFRLSGDRLEPVQGDPDAAYTERTYRLNERRRREYRRLRRELIEDRTYILACDPDLSRRLHTLASETTDAAARRDLLQAARQLRERRLQAWTDLQLFRPIPVDAILQCPCDAGECVLPAPLAKQVNLLARFE